jgi:hypothetical protein
MVWLTNHCKSNTVLTRNLRHWLLASVLRPLSCCILRLLGFRSLFLTKFEIVNFVWEYPGAREKVVFIRVNSLKSFKISSEESFACYLVDSWEVIDFLVALKLLQSKQVDSYIRPPEIEISFRHVLLFAYLPSHHFSSNLIDERIFRAGCIYNNLFLVNFRGRFH